MDFIWVKNTILSLLIFTALLDDWSLSYFGILVKPIPLRRRREDDAPINLFLPFFYIPAALYVLHPTWHLPYDSVNWVSDDVTLKTSTLVLLCKCCTMYILVSSQTEIRKPPIQYKCLCVFVIFGLPSFYLTTKSKKCSNPLINKYVLNVIEHKYIVSVLIIFWNT